MTADGVGIDDGFWWSGRVRLGLGFGLGFGLGLGVGGLGVGCAPASMLASSCRFEGSRRQARWQAYRAGRQAVGLQGWVARVGLGLHG